MLQLFLLFVVAVSAQTVPKVATYKGYEFSFYTNEASGKLTYDDAKQVCVNAGARLAEIKSADVQDFITTQLTDLGLVESFNNWVQGYWIGGVCGGGKNNWKWEDGTSIGGSDYENWYVGCGITEPNSNFATSRSYIYPYKEGNIYGLTCTGTLGTWGDDEKSSMKNWICLKDINECSSDPCENGGSCVDEINQFTCDCTDGYTGVICETDLCASNPCQNNGTCVPQAENYSCLCKDSMVGTNCEIDLCDPSPCENSGTCVRNPDGKFSCDCKPAYNGTLCENANYESSENVDYLLHINYNSFSTFSRSSEDCKLNGQSGLVIIKDKETQKNIENKAIELYGQGAKEFWIGAERKYTGWFWLDGSQLTFTNWGETGNDGAGNCLKMVSQSGSSQLQWIAGQCEEQLGYICEKPANNIDPCMETECLNSGTCFSSGSHFNCQCVAGFKGVNCEIKISDLCNPSPCKNGGTCVPETGDYSCNCLDGFEGKNCSVDLCYPNPCENGGTCNHTPGGYQCNCADGFVGDYCQFGIPLISVDGVPTFSLVITRNQTQSIS